MHHADRAQVLESILVCRMLNACFIFMSEYCQVFSGSMVGQYNSTSFLDDLAWAASWLYKATEDSDYLADAINWYGRHIGGSVRSLPPCSLLSILSVSEELP